MGLFAPATPRVCNLPGMVPPLVSPFSNVMPFVCALNHDLSKCVPPTHHTGRHEGNTQTHTDLLYLLVAAESLQHGTTFGIDVEAHMCRHLKP